jgi:hypothetical protein
MSEKKAANPIHKFHAREKSDKDDKTYYFSGGSKEDKQVNLKDVVVFVFPQENEDGTLTMKVVLCAGNKSKS